jgi:hypothetical protein
MYTWTRVMKRLKPINDFVDGMSVLPQLQRNLAKDEIEGLLHKLYEVAQRKISYDIEIDNWSTAIPKIRRSAKVMRGIKKSFDQAANRFASISTKHPVEVSYLDDLTLAHQEDRFSEALVEILRSLRKMGEDAALVEAIIVSNVHPAKRTESEKKLITAHLPRTRREDAYRQFLRPKTPAVDHWFIGVAADHLERVEKETGTGIRGKEKIIARLFEMMGEPGRTEESISKELRRQKNQGRPRLHQPVSPNDDEYGPDLLP